LRAEETSNCIEKARRNHGDTRVARLQLNGIEKVYPNGFKAVHGVDLEVRDGEFMVFVGPSGCAKSTLLAHGGRSGIHQRRRAAHRRSSAVNDLRAQGSAASPWCSRTTRSTRT
jgi:ABC-type phosphonate transport system ATPase subunit